MRRALPLVFIAYFLFATSAHAGVVINEVFYHAPDDFDELQFIELHNPDAKAVDLSGWKLAADVQYVFPAKTSIDAGGYLVLCKDRNEFRKHYKFDAAGQFQGALGHGSGHIELQDAKGKKVESVKYRSRSPWPVAADGYSSSLERICPTSNVTGPENWAASPLAPGSPKAAGTPGRKNANYVETFPPKIADVTFTPAHAEPNQEIKVSANVTSKEGLASVELLYRIAGSGFEKDEIALQMQSEGKSKYTATIPAQKPGQIVRFRVKAVDAKGAERLYPNKNDLRPALSVYVHDKFTPGQKLPFGYIINIGSIEFRLAQRGPQGGGLGPAHPNPPGQGKSAFVYVDPVTGTPELFDFISIPPRSGGWRVRFHKDHTLGDMRTIVLIFEAMDRWILAEPLAYEVYRLAGNAACRTDHVRTWIDGRPVGYQLLIEVVNKSFLKHNELNSNGNLYKVNWFGGGLADKHEKKTYVHTGHKDLEAIVGELGRTTGDAQWAVIQKNFDVKQVANYFAANMVLSHWDGFFNNYFAYHDVKGTGKWTMYPWDQDKTWGFHDGIQGYGIFYDMPLTFGMAGDRPPGWPASKPAPDFFYAGPIWWRPGGYFSKPLLANSTFRKQFLARTKDILENVYTEAKFFPLIDKMGERLKEDVRIRAEILRQNPKAAEEHLRRNLDSLKEHLTKRRRFLLEQEELKKSG